MEGELLLPSYLYRFIRLDFVTINSVVILDCTIIILGGDTVPEWIEAGRKTQAFWYDCVERDVTLQPMSAMLEMSPYREEIQGNLGLSQSVQMILRAGYVEKYGENTGIRRNLSEYITVIGADQTE